MLHKQHLSTLLIGCVLFSSANAQEASGIAPEETTQLMEQELSNEQQQMSIAERVRQLIRSMITQPEDKGARTQARDQNRGTQSNFGIGYENRNQLLSDSSGNAVHGVATQSAESTSDGNDSGGSGDSGGSDGSGGGR